MGITSLILVNRRFSASLASALSRPNPALGVVLSGVAAILLTTQFVVPMADLFTFARITAGDLVTIALLSIAALFLLEMVERLWGSRLLE